MIQHKIKIIENLNPAHAIKSFHRNTILIKAEEKRQKDEKWARYKDDNPRGAGNTMNRG